MDRLAKETRGGPDVADDLLEGSVEAPRLLVAEDLRHRRQRGRRDEQRNVVGGGPGEGAERGVEQGSSPGGIDEGAVEAYQSWGLAHVGPGIPAVQQRELLEAERVDGVVEEGRGSMVEVVVVLVVRGVRDVEVSDDEPGAVALRIQQGELGEEVGAEGGIAGCVDVGDNEGLSVGDSEEEAGEREPEPHHMREAHRAGIPGRDGTAGRANSVEGFESGDWVGGTWRF